MPKYRNRDLRKDILVTLAYVPYSPFRIKAILNALRPTGYEDLSDRCKQNVHSSFAG